MAATSSCLCVYSAVCVAGVEVRERGTGEGHGAMAWTPSFTMVVCTECQGFRSECVRQASGSIP